jgi:hypothetical protein
MSDESKKTEKSDDTLASVTAYEAERKLLKQLSGLADSSPPKYLRRVLGEHLTTLPASIQAALRGSSCSVAAGVPAIPRETSDVNGTPSEISTDTFLPPESRTPGGSWE